MSGLGQWGWSGSGAPQARDGADHDKRKGRDTMRRLCASATLAAVGAGAFALWLAADRAAAAADQSPGQPAVSDRELGLRKTTLTDDRVPPVFVFPEASPGNSRRIPHSPDGGPPLIPHSLDGLVPITREENLCLMCHATGSIDPADAPQAPRSHWIDLRAAPGVVRETIAGARWACTTCHVPQSNAPPLVENGFGSSGPEYAAGLVRAAAADRAFRHDRLGARHRVAARPTRWPRGLLGLGAAQ